MRLPLTDQFLWSLFNSIQGVDKALYSFPRTWKDILCPDSFRLRKEYERKRAKRSFSQFISYLVKQGYIKHVFTGDTSRVLITRKGAQKALRIQWKLRKKKHRADGKLQMVIFDIPEKKKFLREAFRGALSLMGYQKLQQSVWVCPYEVSQETEEAIKEYSLNGYVRSFIIEKVEI